MKKLILSILSVAVVAGSVFAFAGCSSNSTTGKDFSEEIAELQQQLRELENKNNSLQSDLDAAESEINKLKNQNDLFTGSPKFNYSINETIPYYINGNKIFDFKITGFDYYTNSGAIGLDYSVVFSPAFSVSPETVLSATLYDVTKNITKKPSYNNANAITFNNESNTNKQIILYYLNNPFASITAKPNIKS